MRVYSKHSLINGSGVGESLPPANNEDKMSEKIPTWGYKGTEAQIFELNPGESLPAGWADHPGAAVPPPPEKKTAKAKKPDAEVAEPEVTEEGAPDGDGN